MQSPEKGLIGAAFLDLLAPIAKQSKEFVNCVKTRRDRQADWGWSRTANLVERPWLSILQCRATSPTS